ncbi:thioredoxin-1, putative [Entamoeba invadens IP1]|uniref:Thioredoxin n=1 Tax=Entamoeba invadens IP1 TaxID=370355 RepID=L7FMM0_ENTIV|nr:thioredoxin-1, putative [Entamoeba invadens IP1]ELP89548.1 thioredoxin-1, putative [Entamoeba invadens IP1]|eukprot:XP_004256319.1 thioredoxin-1, putative [Entamoeba invadens IP1]
METPFIANVEEFEKKKEENNLVVYFCAKWCGPCCAFQPIFDEIVSTSHSGKTFVKVDADDGEEILLKYDVSCVPTFILFKDNVEVKRLNGTNRKEVEELFELF